MSDVMTKPPSDKLNKDKVLEWLLAHPDFLNQHPELFDVMTPPQEKQGKGIADFQYYMVKRLKADRDEVLQSAQEIVETSRMNMSNQSRIHTAVLMVLEAYSFEDFIRTITMDITSVLGVDIISLLVEAEEDFIPHINVSGVRLLPAGSTQHLMGDSAVLLEDGIIGVEDVYGGGAKLVASQAILRLNLSGGMPSVLVAFGSRDPNMFVAGQGTDLICFLGRVLERCFALWLDLPPKI